MRYKEELAGLVYVAIVFSIVKFVPGSTAGWLLALIVILTTLWGCLFYSQ